MMELILSRHGETLENQQHILQGQLPGTLSPLGIAQAEKLAEMLQEETIDNIVSSDLARSYNTAVAVARKHGLTPRHRPLALLYSQLDKNNICIELHILKNVCRQ